MRVNYGKNTLNMVVSAAKNGQMSASDNATLLSDTTSLMKSEKVSMPAFVTMMSAFTNITNTETLDMIKSSISTIKK